MFGWIKSLFGKKKIEPLVLTQEDLAPAREPKVEQAEPVAEPKKQAKKPATKKSKKGTGTCDFSKLTKTQLLAEAKHRGVKANASMKKQDILDRLNAAKK